MLTSWVLSAFLIGSCPWALASDEAELLSVDSTHGASTSAEEHPDTILHPDLVCTRDGGSDVLPTIAIARGRAYLLKDPDEDVSSPVALLTSFRVVSARGDKHVNSMSLGAVYVSKDPNASFRLEIFAPKKQKEIFGDAQVLGHRYDVYCETDVKKIPLNNFSAD
jgi:hypothetical protein